MDYGTRVSLSQQEVFNNKHEAPLAQFVTRLTQFTQFCAKKIKEEGKSISREFDYLGSPEMGQKLCSHSPISGDAKAFARLFCHACYFAFFCLCNYWSSTKAINIMTQKLLSWGHVFHMMLRQNFSRQISVSCNNKWRRDNRRQRMRLIENQFQFYWIC